MDFLTWKTALQFAGFCLVGTFHTSLDFVVYNLLTRRSVGFSRVKANLISTTFALACNFTANFLLVFRPQVARLPTRLAEHLAVTCFSSYVMQSAVIHLMSRVWAGPVRSLVAQSRKLTILQRLTDDAIERNVVKALAVAVGLVWNFLWYRFLVFADGP